MLRAARWFGCGGPSPRGLDAARTIGLTIAVLVAWLDPVAASAQGGRELGSPWGPGGAPTSGDGAEAAEDELSGEAGDHLTLTPVEPGDAASAELPAAPSDTVIPPPPGTGYGTIGVAGLPSGAMGRAASGLRLPSTISTRMRALEGDLQALALRGSGYIVDGVVQLLSSGVSIAVGVLFLTGGVGASNDAFSAYLFTMGGVGVARGLLTLLVPVTPSESAVAYAHPLPLTSYAEARLRLRSREGELERLATAGLVGRVIDGSLGVGVGLAMIPIFAVVGFDETQPLNYVMLLLAGVSTVTGIITLFSTSDAERRWNGYVELRDRLQVTAAGGEDERWLDEHADEDEPLSVLPDATGPTFAVNVGLGGGSLRMDF